jgi:hypothetical protein
MDVMTGVCIGKKNKSRIEQFMADLLNFRAVILWVIAPKKVVIRDENQNRLENLKQLGRERSILYS